MATAAGRDLSSQACVASFGMYMPMCGMCNCMQLMCERGRRMFAAVVRGVYSKRMFAAGRLILAVAAGLLRQLVIVVAVLAE